MEPRHAVRLDFLPAEELHTPRNGAIWDLGGSRSLHSRDSRYASDNSTLSSCLRQGDRVLPSSQTQAEECKRSGVHLLAQKHTVTAHRKLDWIPKQESPKGLGSPCFLDVAASWKPKRERQWNARSLADEVYRPSGIFRQTDSVPAVPIELHLAGHRIACVVMLESDCTGFVRTIGSGRDVPTEGSTGWSMDKKTATSAGGR